MCMSINIQHCIHSSDDTINQYYSKWDQEGNRKKRTSATKNCSNDNNAALLIDIKHEHYFQITYTEKQHMFRVFMHATKHFIFCSDQHHILFSFFSLPLVLVIRIYLRLYFSCYVSISLKENGDCCELRCCFLSVKFPESKKHFLEK